MTGTDYRCAYCGRPVIGEFVSGRAGNVYHMECTRGPLSEEFVRDFLRDECKKVGGQAKWAEQNGVSAAYVNDVVRGRRDPGDSICAPLGLRRQVTYLYDHDRATAAEAKRKR